MNAFLENFSEHSQWFGQMLSDANSFDPEMYAPHWPKDPDSDMEIIGTIPEDIRKYWSFARFCDREYKQLSVDMGYSKPDDSARSTAYQLKVKHDVMLTIFWSLVKEYFNMWHDQRPLGIREGWALVVTKEKETNPFFQIFGGHI